MAYQDSFEAAMTALREARPAEAEPLLRACTEEAPQEAEGWLFLGVALGLQEQFEPAAAALGRAAELAPDDPRVAYNQARLAYRRGDLEQAAAAYQLTLALDPAHAKAREALLDLGQDVAPPPPVGFPPIESQIEAPTDVALAGSWRLAEFDIVSLVRVWPIASLLLGFVMGAAMGVAALLAHELQLGTQAAQQPLSQPLGAVIAAALGALIYNWLAGRLGGLRGNLATEGVWTILQRVSPSSYARLVTAVTAVMGLLFFVLLAPLALVAVLLTGHGHTARLALVTLVACGGGYLALVAGSYLWSAFEAFFYNLVAQLTGGLAVSLEPAGRMVVARRLDFARSALTLWLARLPGVVVGVSLMVAVMVAMRHVPLSATDTPPPVFTTPQLAVLALLMLVQPFLEVAFYNLAARWVGGARVRLESAEQEL
jgi:hypothetical protein